MRSIQYAAALRLTRKSLEYWITRIHAGDDSLRAVTVA